MLRRVGIGLAEIDESSADDMLGDEKMGIRPVPLSMTERGGAAAVMRLIEIEGRGPGAGLRGLAEIERSGRRHRG